MFIVEAKRTHILKRVNLRVCQGCVRNSRLVLSKCGRSDEREAQQRDLQEQWAGVSVEKLSVRTGDRLAGSVRQVREV